jgi:hypothetical protein
MGFCLNRSTIDNIFIIRQSFEKLYEHNIDLHIVDVDYTQTLDFVFLE